MKKKIAIGSLLVAAPPLAIGGGLPYTFQSGRPTGRTRRYAAAILSATVLAAVLGGSGTAMAQVVTGDGRPCYTGPRGGTYAINSHGNKDYSACIDYGKLRPTAPVADQGSFAPRSLGPTCHVGPRGGTYTITASGRKNYSGC